MSLRLDSRAPTFQSPTTIGKMGSEIKTCGPKHLRRFARLDRGTSCWKTSQISLLSRTEEEYSGTWQTPFLISEGSSFHIQFWGGILKEKGYGLLPAPQASDGMRLMFSVENLKNARRKHEEKGSHLGSYLAETLAVDYGVSQTPTLSEVLMGWPIGWSDLKPLATDKFQSWLRQHG